MVTPAGAGPARRAELSESLVGLVDGDRDPYPVYAVLRDEAPVLWCDALSAWVLTRWDDVTRAFEDAEHFGQLMGTPGTSSIHGRALLQMTGDEHRRKSAIVSRRIRSPRLLESALTDMVARLIEHFGSVLPLAPEVADVKGGLTTPVPLSVIGELMDMQEAARFAHWYHAIVAAGVANVRGDPEVHARGLEARQELYDFVTPIIEQKRLHPGDELLSDLCAMEYEGERLSDDEVRSFCSFLLSAGIETTDRALTSLFKQLALEPASWQQVRDDRSLVSSACAEILRFRAPVQGTVRVVARDLSLRGEELRSGDKVIVLAGAANHDPEVFAEPDRFDVTRFVGTERPQFTPIGPLRAFGAGAHTCTGSLLAKLEMERTLTYLLDRCESIELVGPAPEDAGFMLRSAPTLELRLHPCQPTG